MRVPLILLALACCATAMPARLSGQARSQARALALQRVNVVDVRAGRVLVDRTVVVELGRIISVGPADSVRPPAVADVVDARSKYLIPGLWDMHVHAAWPGIAEAFAPLFVANGVTGVREMYGDMAEIRAWKGRYATGQPWPRMVAAGHILDGPKPFWPGSTVAATAADARHAVDSLRAAGADFIKVYNGLPRDAYVAALEEAKRVGTYVVGHVPEAVSVAEASDLGQRAIEHLGSVALDCSNEAESLRARRIAAAGDSSGGLLAAHARQTARILATQDSARCSELVARLARNRTWQVPTLVVLRSMASLDDGRFTADPRVRYMPKEVVASWNWRTDFRFRSRTPAGWANAKRLYRRNLEIVGAMHRAGVHILAGTDVLNPFAFPGFSLHDELALLVGAGLSPAEALRSATLDPATFLGAADSLGSVEAGKRADLVLLDADPLEDIGNTRRVRAVILNGRLYDRAELDALLAAAERSTKRRR